MDVMAVKFCMRRKRLRAYALPFNGRFFFFFAFIHSLYSLENPLIKLSNWRCLGGWWAACGLLPVCWRSQRLVTAEAHTYILNKRTKGPKMAWGKGWGYLNRGTLSGYRYLPFYLWLPFYSRLLFFPLWPQLSPILKLTSIRRTNSSFCWNMPLLSGWRPTQLLSGWCPGLQC